MVETIFWLVWVFWYLEGVFTFQFGSGWYGCEVMGIALVDFGVMVLELDTSFAGCFCLELGGVKKWTSGRVFSMEDVAGSCFGVLVVVQPDQARKDAHHISVHFF